MVRTRKKIKLLGKKPGPKVEFSKAKLEQVELLAKLGATNNQLAEFFDKNSSTIDSWIKNNKEFRKARKKGGMVADLKVIQCMFKRATGYDYTEEQVLIINGKIKKVKVKKHAIPSEKSILAWLTNRQRLLWTNSYANLNVNYKGSIEHTHKTVKELQLNDLSKEAQDLIFEISQQQVLDGNRDN